MVRSYWRETGGRTDGLGPTLEEDCCVCGGEVGKWNRRTEGNLSSRGEGKKQWVISASLRAFKKPCVLIFQAGDRPLGEKRLRVAARHLPIHRGPLRSTWLGAKRRREDAQSKTSEREAKGCLGGSAEGHAA